MNIVSTTKTVTEYALTITESEAVEALTDPYSPGERIAEQLRAAGVSTNGNGNSNGGHPHAKPKLESHIQIGRGRKATKASVRKAARPNGVECPKCGQTLPTQGFLARHLIKKHGFTSPAPANGAHPEAAHAAA